MIENFTLPSTPNPTTGRTRVLLLGSTGSIGTQAIDVMTRCGEDNHFELVGIAAGGNNIDLVCHQATTWNIPPAHIAIANPDAAATISQRLGAPVLSGPDAATRLTENLAGDVDVVLNALVGAMGLPATLATLAAGTRLALANKESLVAGGELVMAAAAPGQLIPVDSEHSAIAQCLRSGRACEVDRLVLTASGGPFRGWSRTQLMDATPQQAGAHPTWSMGPMNTLNSASMINKGLELIEASLMFGIHPDRIDVTVHPQSIIHSMVTFTDGATIAQASPPSMTLPIALALGWPDRLAHAEPPLNFADIMDWHFEPLDDDVFPAVRLARAAAAAGGSMPAIYNAANEVAADAFLAGKIRFPHIVDTVGEVLDHLSATPRPHSIPDILAADAAARAAAAQCVTRLAG